MAASLVPHPVQERGEGRPAAGVEEHREPRADEALPVRRGWRSRPTRSRRGRGVPVPKDLGLPSHPEELLVLQLVDQGERVLVREGTVRAVPARRYDRLGLPPELIGRRFPPFRSHARPSLAVPVTSANASRICSPTPRSPRRGTGSSADGGHLSGEATCARGRGDLRAPRLPACRWPAQARGRRSYLEVAANLTLRPLRVVKGCRAMDRNVYPAGRPSAGPEASG